MIANEPKLNFPENVSYPIKILYVDDDPDFLEVVKVILEGHEEFIVDISNSGHEALERMKNFRYDVVLSDYRMVRMDGITFLRGIREFNANIPFILFSGMVEEEVINKAKQSGLSLYLYKEGDPASLFRKLEEGILEVVLKTRPDSAASAEYQVY